MSNENSALFAQLWPEADRRIKHLEHMVVSMALDSSIYLGVCVNAKCGAPRHPHWMKEPQVAWSEPIVYLPDDEVTDADRR